MKIYDSNYKPEPDINSLTQIVDILEPNREVENRSVQIVNDVVTANNKEELQKQFELFNINQSKKNALRVVKLSKLLDKVDDEVITRFEKRPDQMSNKELLDYMEAISSQIDRSQKAVDTIRPPSDSIIARTGGDIVNQSKGDEYNINLGTELSKETKEDVVDAIKGIIGILQNTSAKNLTQPSDPTEVNIEVVEEKDSE